MVDFLKKTIEGVVRIKNKEQPPQATQEKKQGTSSSEDRKPERKTSDASSSTEKHSKPEPKQSSGGEPSGNRSQEQDQKSSSGRRRRSRSRRGGGRSSSGGNSDSRQENKPSSQSSSPSRSRKPDQNLEKRLEEDAAWDPETFQVEPEEDKVRFHDLPIHRSVMHAVADLGFKFCTPIQAEILGSTLNDRDATGQAQTGTGKTAAFLITIFCRLMNKPESRSEQPGTPRALILAPTRELVVQIDKDAKGLGKYLPLQTVACYGGTGYGKQEELLSGQVDVIAATPGRLIDFCRKKVIDLSQVEILVIDEADRMLDMGFIPDVKKIVYMTPHKDKRQTLFFSATITGDVERLANSWTRDPVDVKIEPEHIASEQVNQRVFTITSDQKFTLLFNLLNQKHLTRVMIFANRRDQAEDLAVYLHAYGFKAALISGALPQNQRSRTLEDFREGRIDIMVATDVAGRGIHIQDVSHVINYHLPMDPEDYVHRIGRTGRAGSEGTSISFACEEDGFHIPEIEEYMGRPLPCEVPDESLLAEVPNVGNQKLKASRDKFSSGSSRGNRSGGGGRGRRSGGGRGGNRSGSGGGRSRSR